MDFSQLLHVAKKNNEEVKYGSNGKYYSTKFSAPKKETKEKKLSDNIKRFLEKKDQEERDKARKEREKVQQLLAMRDEKSKNKIRKMLKVTKSANKSVLDDAKNLNHTAVTMEGPIQPDEDDYGYVSHEAAAFFQKYVEKVGKLPEDKVPGSRPKTKNDICGTKDRVKAAILKDHEDKPFGKPRLSSSLSTTSGSSKAITAYPTSSKNKDLYDPTAEKEAEDRRRRDEHKQRSRKAAPPPMDFQQLMKLAEKKQFEPIDIVKVEVKKEPERLLTKKEKDELEQRKQLQEERERKKNSHTVEKPKMEPNGRIPKLNSAPKDTFKKPAETPLKLQQPNLPAKAIKTSSLNTNNTKTSTQNALLKKSTSTSSVGTKSNSASTVSKHNSTSSSREVPSKASTYNGPTREFPPRDKVKMPLKDVKKPISTSKMNYKDIKPREFPPKDIPSRKFPPEDVIRPKLNSKSSNKRRIYDEDDDDYDSEMDDFIDDGEIDDPAQVSNYIKEIFGYDKRKYRQIDEEDDAAMESSFAQQMREETISKKIGIMEDLEDMRKEQEEKQRKLVGLKKKKYK